MILIRSALLRSVLLLLIAAAAAIPGSLSPVGRQLGLYENLRDAAAIVFGVVGAWLALVYPRALTNLKARTPSGADPETAIAKRLFDALLYSAAVLAVTIVLPVAHQLVWAFPALWVAHTWLRGASFALLVALTGILLWALLLAVAPGENARRDVNHLERKREFRESRRAAGGS